jgi:hypothetical protein
LTITVGLLTYEKYYFPKSSQDQLLVFISLFPSDSSDNSKVDFDTAEELKEQIGNVTGSSTQVKILEPLQVTSDEEAVYRGKKVCANIVLYGEQKDRYGHITELEYHIIPINFETMISEPIVLNMTDNVKFNATFSPYSADSIVIVESLTENVSSTVNALCALESYNKSDYVSAINMFKSITSYKNKDSILYYIANCYSFEGYVAKIILLPY